MLRRIQLVGAGLFVLAAIAVAATELARPVEARQQGTGCCVVGQPTTCAGEMECVAPAPSNCGAQNPPFTGHCVKKVVEPDPDPEPIGGDN